MKDEGIEGDPVRWSLTQRKTRFPSMVKQAGYEEIAARIDQQTITDQLIQLKTEILAKMLISVEQPGVRTKSQARRPAQRLGLSRFDPILRNLERGRIYLLLCREFTK